MSAHGHAHPPIAHGTSETVDTPPTGPVSLPRRIATAPIRLYRKVLSPAMPARCKYYPSCSEYAVQSVERFGILRGLILAAWRLLRCNPWSHGGYDPVEAQRLFRRPSRPTDDPQ